jgi:hypothetical protein
MSTSLQFALTPASPQPDSILFRLPREIRDGIYHKTFTGQSMFRPFSTSRTAPADPENRSHNLLQLRYRDPNPDANPRHRTNRPWSPDHPEWLLTCKAMLHEGTAQFLCNAEWFSHGYGYRTREAKHWTTRLPLDRSKVSRMELYVENLSNYSTPYRYEGTDTRQYLGYIADLMRDANMKMDTIRFVGHSYSLYLTNLHCDFQTENMMHNLMAIFDGVDAKKWEFGIQDSPRLDKIWVLFEWVGDEKGKSKEGGLRLMVREWTKRINREIKPEDDLERLLPKGWLGKRKPCLCEECELDRAEGGQGDWGGGR